MRSLPMLLRPLDYLRIRHDAKPLFDWWIPVVIALLLTIGIVLLPVRVVLLGEAGLIAGFNSLLQVLTGFYIAALAALATFNKAGMDELMAGDPPRLLTSVRGHDTEIRLTRRRFLCLMFGYLALASMLLYLGGLAANLLRDNLAILMPVETNGIVYLVSVFLYLFLSSNLVVTTLLGLYYMSDRIHRPDSSLGNTEEQDQEER